jgi:hypothetical protein
VRRVALVVALLAAAAGNAAAEPGDRAPTLASLPGFHGAAGAVRESWLAQSTACGTGAGYPWPIAPFRRAHPVRGNFGDPRTIYRTGGGSFSFHNGVDISAAPGTPVYPVVSGRVVETGSNHVIVAAGLRRFQYWHIVRIVRLGQRVRAQGSVLGFVQRRPAHVHFAEIDDGVVQNPLLPGHLMHYVDRVAPTVEGLAFRSPTGHALRPGALAGTVEAVVWADDRSSRSVPGPWHGLPVAPALVALSISTPEGRLVRQIVLADFRHTLPDDELFWHVYASGTYQNVPAVGRRLNLGTPGRYLYGAPLGPLPAGPLVATAVARDICGNEGVLRLPVDVVGGPQQAPQPPTGEAPAPSPGRLIAWPTGRTAYTVVLDSGTDAAAADAAARRAIADGLDHVGVLRSERFANLVPGLAVVFSGVYATADDAAAAAFAVSGRFPGAYPRLVAPSPRPGPSTSPSPSPSPSPRPPPQASALVLASVPVGEGRGAAAREAIRARAAGLSHVRVLRSDAVRGFRRGYFLVVSDPGPPPAAFPTAYPRELYARAASNRRPTASQLTTFHHAAR